MAQFLFIIIIVLVGSGVVSACCGCDAAGPSTGCGSVGVGEHVHGSSLQLTFSSVSFWTLVANVVHFCNANGLQHPYTAAAVAAWGPAWFVPCPAGELHLCSVTMFVPQGTAHRGPCRCLAQH
jgi:hypothetical protein